jgi:Amt family ammonium transporter
MNPIAKKWFPAFILLIAISLFALFSPVEKANPDLSKINFADLAWVLVASGLVFLMTPGLSFFYGGMVSRKNIISTMLQGFIACGVISILWVVVGFSLAFGTSIGGFIGNPLTYFMMHGVSSAGPWPLAPTIPLLLYALFQLKFAIITPALVVGAFAERIRFSAYLLFMVLFSLFIYAPIAHWTWHPDGFLAKLGVLDFAGGTVVHISAGAAALAGALALKRRKAHIENIVHPPANIPFVVLGTGLLWFGWFGFNAGSAFSASSLAVHAFFTTNTASASAALAWIFFDAVRGRKPSALGFCIGAVVGLVAITPGAGYVGIGQSVFIGSLASIISNLAVHWKSKSSIDDTLDVFPCHGLGGIVGMILTGFFASKKINPAGADGWFYGNFEVFKFNFLGMLLVLIFSFSMGFLIFKFVDLIIPLRVESEHELMGLDESQHDEAF